MITFIRKTEKQKAFPLFSEYKTNSRELTFSTCACEACCRVFMTMSRYFLKWGPIANATSPNTDNIWGFTDRWTVEFWGKKTKHNLILIIIHFRKTFFFISKRIPIFCIKAEKVWRLENERQHFELMLYQNLYISSLYAIKYFILMFHGNSINHIR